MFVDKTEQLLKNTRDKNIFNDHFGGILSNEIIGQSCPHYSEREE